MWWERESGDDSDSASCGWGVMGVWVDQTKELKEIWCEIEEQGVYFAGGEREEKCVEEGEYVVGEWRSGVMLE